MASDERALATDTQLTTGFEDLVGDAKAALRRALFNSPDKKTIVSVATTILEMAGQREKVRSKYAGEVSRVPILIKDSNVQLLLETARHIGVDVDER